MTFKERETTMQWLEFPFIFCQAGLQLTKLFMKILMTLLLLEDNKEDLPQPLQSYSLPEPKDSHMKITEHMKRPPMMTVDQRKKRREEQEQETLAQCSGQPSAYNCSGLPAEKELMKSITIAQRKEHIQQTLAKVNRPSVENDCNRPPVKQGGGKKVRFLIPPYDINDDFARAIRF